MGSKQELVARAFVAYENNAPIVETAEEAKANIAAQNNLKLSLHDAVIPDAFELKSSKLKKVLV